MQKTKLVVVSRMEPHHEFWVLQSHAETDGFEDFFRCDIASPVEFCHEFAKAGEDGVGKPDVRLFFVGFRANFIAFLRIA